MKKQIFNIYLAMALIGMSSCTSNEDGIVLQPKDTPITFDVQHPSQNGVRATATAFEEGNKIGLFMAEATSPLEIGGNLVNNEPITLKSGVWSASHNLYWGEGSYNAYAYYPYMKIESIEDQSFSVAIDQSKPASEEGLSAYEGSDLLYAQNKNITASTSAVQLTFKHILSKLSIRLVKGEDFEGDMPTDAEVYIHNTVPSATVDLSVGVATKLPTGQRITLKANKEGDFDYGAVIVPQRIDNRMPLIEVIMKGVSYLFESRFLFKPGVNHLVNLVITDNPDQVKIDVGGEIQNWQ